MFGRSRSSLPTSIHSARAALFFVLVLVLSTCAIRRTPPPRSSGTVTRTPHRGSRTGGAEAPAPDDTEEPEVVVAGAPPDVAPEPAPIGEDEERSDSPDVDAPDDRPVLDVLEGRASFYADRFHGRSTASGEPYDMHALTAASRDLPFGTILRVTRVDTGASVEVRVNDRGPFRDHRRILDLSRAAAEALDMIAAGVVEVRVEILERPEE